MTRFESDLHVTVTGMADEPGKAIGNTLLYILQSFGSSETGLDLRRVHKILVAEDYGEALVSLSSRTASGNSIKHTKEGYAVGVAKVQLLPRNDDIEILPVFDANFLLPLTVGPESTDFKRVLHAVHHEFCHVHDYNQQIDAFPNVFLKQRYTGKNALLRPLADVCWAEYFANRVSAHSAPADFVLSFCHSLMSAIERTKDQVTGQIVEFVFDRDYERLLQQFRRDGEFLPKSASYVLGYLDGLGKSLDELAPDAATALRGSYFEDTWKAMQTTLRSMWETYPRGWNDISVFEGLAEVFHRYHTKMGIIVSEDGGVRAHLPDA